jgi:hypothetical protein
VRPARNTTAQQQRGVLCALIAGTALAYFSLGLCANAALNDVQSTIGAGLAAR